MHHRSCLHLRQLAGPRGGGSHHFDEEEEVVAAAVRDGERVELDGRNRGDVEVNDGADHAAERTAREAVVPRDDLENRDIGDPVNRVDSAAPRKEGKDPHRPINDEKGEWEAESERKARTMNEEKREEADCEEEVGRVEQLPTISSNGWIRDGHQNEGEREAPDKKSCCRKSIEGEKRELGGGSTRIRPCVREDAIESKRWRFDPVLSSPILEEQREHEKRSREREEESVDHSISRPTDPLVDCK